MICDLKKRRPLDDNYPDGYYMESDDDYLMNNWELAVEMLEKLEGKDSNYFLGIAQSLVATVEQDTVTTDNERLATARADGEH